MSVLAIDPGSEQSGYVVYGGEKPTKFGLLDNAEMRREVVRQILHDDKTVHLAIEFPHARGMLASNELFATCRWAGRFAEAWGPQDSVTYVDRHKVKMHICHAANAKDCNIRAALIDKWGGQDKAIGGTKCRKCKGKGWFGSGRPTCSKCHGEKWLFPPGPLDGVANDEWQALAVAVTWWETMRQ